MNLAFGGGIRSRRAFVRALGWVGAFALLALSNDALAQVLSSNALVAALRKGGYVVVIRHASSPATLPTRQTADLGNVKLERQLDAAGREGAIALGRGLRELKIPVGEVFCSPAFRATETARLAELLKPKFQEELGEAAPGALSISEVQANWLKDEVKKLPKADNTIIVTHNPNLTKAFPDWGGAVAHGEAVVLGLDSKGATRIVGRIKVDEWLRLR